MEDLKVNRLEPPACGFTASFQDSLDSHKDIFHGQIDQLQTIVVTQCKLTGVNPLSQEMAAGALSIKIGKFWFWALIGNILHDLVNFSELEKCKKGFLSITMLFIF
ncbi:uncharacterized protein LOC130778718 [Actinidia eriantha]|uniref:uncharacterized protein LOC130778718 n=1 Tax=Actinidia eriantha TaxID=165200 RepID=UPI00258B2E98|nr:uncharacterized protein LOC130778718 [Actinidia eriantha]